ncbi:MAG TPA: TonB-dependent receptor [Novosphingobium sp.]
MLGYRYRAILLAGSMLAASTAPALAQEGGDIVVTARRVEERLQDVPLSIQVFNQEELTNRNISRAADLVTYTPSLSQNNTFGGDNVRFQIRGFVQEAESAPSVGIYFADAVVPRGAANSVNAGNGAGPGAFFDLQNVQILKGPQGTLFGRNTTGGAILLVPQKPTDKLEGFVEGSIGNYDMKRVQAVINIPVNDTFKLRFGVDRQKRDGWQNNYSGVGPSKMEDVNYIALRGSLVADLTPDLENYTVVTYSHSDIVPGVNQVLACNPNYSSPRDPVNTAFAPLGCGNIRRREAGAAAAGRPGDAYGVMNPHDNPYSITEQWQVINTTTWNVSDTLTIKNIASYAQFTQRILTDFFGTDFLSTDFRPAQTPVHFGFASIGGIEGGYLTNQSTFSEELQFQGKAFDNRLNWVAGFYMENSLPLGKAGNSPPVLITCRDFATRDCSDPLQAALAIPNRNGPGLTAIGSMGVQQSEIKFYNYAVFGQATYALTDQLKVTGGLRYTWDTMKNTTQARLFQFQPLPDYGTRLQNGAPFTCAASFVTAADCTFAFPDAKSDAPTWVLDLVYQPTPNLMAYAKYGRGYRSAIISATNPVLALTQVRPEKVDFYEVGFKSSFDGAVSGMFNVTGFYNDFTDQQIQLSFTPKPAFTGLPRSASAINAGKSEIYGIEVEAGLRPFEGFSLNGSYTWLKTKIKSVPDISSLAAADPRYDIFVDFRPGDRLVLAPEHKLSITAAYKLPVDESVGDITFAATYSYTSNQVSNYKDRLSPSANLRQYSILPSYNLVNLNLNWNSIAGQPIDLSLFVTNLTKEKYLVFTPGVGQASPLEVGRVGEPRMFGARLKYRFGN